MYNYTDHLGNIRLRYTSTGLGNVIQKLEENHYYPFGLKHKKYGSVDKQLVLVEGGREYWLGIAVVPGGSRKTYQYKYKGKEFQDEPRLNFYDYEARNYDVALCRKFSPYTYCLNNPIYFIDPDERW